MSHILEFRNVEKKFGARKVLNGTSFTISEGEIVFILGTSGTGKSVLLKTIVGLLKLDAGEIRLEGETISGYSEEQMFAVRKRCGMVFQNPALFDSINIFENIAFGLRKHLKLTEVEIKQSVGAALSMVHLTGVEDKYPNQISYGMQKRASLARTVVLRPRVLLFDEPTTGLDPVTTGAINKLIQELSRKLKTTSIVVSHDMKCALDIADRIMVLDSGKIVAQGTPSELKKSTNPLVKEFLAEIKEAQQ